MSELSIGAVVGGVRIDAVTGRGGMGVVYRGTQVALKRTVALKVVRGDLASDAQFRRRFTQESEIAASLDHPHIVPIYSAGEDVGRLYVTMRFVEGTDVREAIRQRGRLEPALAAEIVTQVGAALDAAHRRGLVHRDVKPANILLASADGRPHAYLTDFGLSRFADSEQITRTGTVVGTLDYMSPEQLEGRKVDGRVDVYALGCVLYQALTGVVPYPRDTEHAKMWAHMTEPPPRPGAVAPDLPSGFDEVVARAMAKRPDDRYATAGELGAAAAAAARRTTGRAWSAPTVDVPRQATAPPTEAAPQWAGAQPVPPARYGYGSGETSVPPPPAAWHGSPPQWSPPGAVPPHPLPPGSVPQPRWGGAESSPRPQWGPPPSDPRQPWPAQADPGRQWSGPSQPPGGAPGAYWGAQPFAAGQPADARTLVGQPSHPSYPQQVPGPSAARRKNGRTLAFALVGVLVLAAAAIGGFLLLRPKTGTTTGGTGTTTTTATTAPRPAGTLVGSPIAVGKEPRDLEEGGGFVWTANSSDASISKVDPAAGTAQQIGVGGVPIELAVAQGAVWVWNYTDAVTRVDIATGRVSDPITANGTGDITGITAGGGFLWLTHSSSNSVSRIDLGTGQATGTPTTVGANPVSIAFGSRLAYVSNTNETTVSVLDGTTGAVSGAPIQLTEKPAGIAVKDGTIYVGTTDDVTPIDEGSFVVGDPIPLKGGSYFLADTDGIWVSFPLENELRRLDLKGQETRGTPVTGVGKGIGDMVVLDDSLWVSDAANNSVLRVRLGT
jgi:serine/threonine protein kinase/streptogramin lyase